MKILEINQNTEDWLEFRKGKSGGSAFGKLYKVGGKNEITPEMSDQFFKMLAERVARPMTPNDYMDRVPDGVPFSWAVRGHILEPDAAAAFETKTGKKLAPGYVWVDDNQKDSYVSPDRVIYSQDGKIREAVEIKCLSSDKVLKIWWNLKQEEFDNDFDVLPNNEYKAQVIKYFMINDDLEKVYWVLYTDLIPKLELQVLEINREDVEKYLPMAKKIEKHNLDILEYAEKEIENA